MATNNAVNNGGASSDATAITGSDTRQWLSPANVKAVLDTFTAQQLQQNLGLSLSGGNLIVNSALGEALSSNNAGTVRLPSKANPGRLITYQITANQTLTASDLTSNLMGTSASTAWNQDMPWYLYAVSNDSENAISFMVSRVPNRIAAPASSNIGKTGSAVASTQGSFFALDNPTVTDYDTNPALLIGSFRVQKSSSDVWTIQTLDVQDGIGNYQQNRFFTLPTGQGGASAYLRPNGGTAPTFASASYTYNLTSNGIATINVALSGDGGVVGSGAVNAQLNIPYVNWYPTGVDGLLMVNIAGTIRPSYCLFQGSDYIEFERADTGAAATYNSFSAGAREFNGYVTYRVGIV